MDASFLVSLYSLDTNSAAAARTMRASADDRFITTLGQLEVLNALQLRVFRKELSAAQAQAASDLFEDDLQKGVFQTLPLTEESFERAQQLSQRSTASMGTRTADLLHVAAALELRADRLYSFDRQQRDLAQVLGLKLN